MLWIFSVPTHKVFASSSKVDSKRNEAAFGYTFVQDADIAEERDDRVKARESFMFLF